ncbi:MAG TPA: head-tail connector protein [Devosia sp.]|nr:head-tail connector protein [Devosia sp.]
MHVRVVTPPAPIVTWDEAKAHLRLSSNAEQALVESYIAAATAWLDGPAGWLGRCIGVQELELTDCAFGNDRLPFPPIVELVSVEYTDGAGVDQIMPDTDYRLLANGSIWAQQWPSVGQSPDAVRVRYSAGYPDRMVVPEGGGDPVAVSTVPEPIKQAVLLLIGQWFVTRASVAVGSINEMPFAVEALLAPYRVWR